MRRLRCFLCACALGLSETAFALSYYASIDASVLSGTPFSVAFDFIDGGPPSNSVAIRAFSTDGSLGAALLSGGATGSLAAGISLTDSAFFNEYLQVVESASRLTFLIDLSGNSPDPGSLPDTLSFFLLAPDTGWPLFDTTDPTGAGSLFTLQIDDGGAVLSVYDPVGSGLPAAQWAVTAVPEATSLWMLLAGIVVLALRQLGSRSGVCS